jgi:Flp pilus assembly protein TadG
MSRSSKSPGPRNERGAIAIIVGLSLAVLIGAVGLAVDGGRLYVTKTELQNAADACALAASYELTGNPIAPEAFTRGTAAGQFVATQNRVGFQGAVIDPTDVTVEYGTSLASGSTYVPATPPPAGNSKYVRCTIAETGIAPWFMQVLGAGDQTVRAFATATLAPSQSNCAVPMGLCTLPGGAAPSYGYVVGNWYGLDFKETGGPNVNYTGNFRWIDLTPSSIAPGCSGGGGGGANELKCLLEGSGQCSLPEPITGNCPSGGSNQPPGCVGQDGNITALEAAYNSRFGIYKGGGGGPSLSTAKPDFTGYSYSSENWIPASGPPRNAYDGTSSGGQPNFRSARAANLPTSNPPGYANLFFKNPPYSASSAAQHAADGADRRVVVVPIVDCNAAGGFTGGGQYAPIRAYACVLMLDPYRKGSGGSTDTKLEYLGLAKDSGSPCATSGSVGNSTSAGPLVPALVQ